MGRGCASTPRRPLRELAAALPRHGADRRLARQPVLRRAAGRHVADSPSSPARSRWLRAIHRFGGTISAAPELRLRALLASKLREDELAGPRPLDVARRVQRRRAGARGTLERFAERFAPCGFDRPRGADPVYGLAEAAVGLTFPPLGRGPLIERIDARTARSRRARRGRRRRRTPRSRWWAAAAASRPRDPRRRPGGRRAAGAHRGRLEFRGPSATRATSAIPRPPRASSATAGSTPATSATSPAASVYLTSRAKDLIKRGGHNLHPYDLEAAVGDLPGVRKGCVARLRHHRSRQRHRARGRRRDRRGRRGRARRAARADRRARRGSPRRPRRRSAAGAAAHRAQDVERQDPPGSRARPLSGGQALLAPVGPALAVGAGGGLRGRRASVPRRAQGPRDSLCGLRLDAFFPDRPHGMGRRARGAATRLALVADSGRHSNAAPARLHTAGCDRGRADTAAWDP